MANNTKATLAAMLAGTVTKETEMMRVRTTGDANVKVAAQIIKESNLPSAEQLSFKKVVGSNGVATMVDANAPQAQGGYGSVPQDAIVALLGGKKINEIKKELSNNEIITEAVTPIVASNDIREEIRRRTSGEPSLKSVVMPNSTTANVGNIDAAQLVDLVENCVYDILGSIVGQVNNTMKDKNLIKEKLTESIMFLQLTQSLKK